MLRKALSVVFALAGLAMPGVASDTSVFILVHGASSNGAYWGPITDRLRTEGRVVEAVDLPLGSPSITLADQAAAILAAMDRHPDRPVTLVAHSAGTRPAVAAWDRARDRVEAAVFIEGMPPVPGADRVAIPSDERALNVLAANAPEILESGLLPPTASPASAHRTTARPHPVATLYGSVPLSAGPLPAIPLMFVIADDSTIRDFKEIGDLLQTVPGWSVRRIPGGHDVVQDAPGALLDLLLTWP